MTVIRKPIEIPGVLNTILGVGRRADGMYYAADLCTSPNINMWAKNKPFRMATPGPATDSDRHSHMYGIVINASNGYWEYQKPRGDSVSPMEWYRIPDFEGYNPDAQPPMFNFYSVPTPFSIDTDELRISPEEFFRRNDQNVELTLDLFPSLYVQTYYIGLLVKNRTTGKMLYFTGETTLRDYFEGASVQIVNISIENLGANSGDVIEIWVCCARTRDVQQGATCTQTMLDSGEVVKIAISETLGHTTTVAGVFSAKDIYYLGAASSVWDMFRPAITAPVNYRSHLVGASIDLYADYIFANTETPRIYVELFVNNESTPVAHKVVTLGPTKIDQYGMFTVDFTCSKYIDFTQGDTEFPVLFDVAIRRADGDGNPIGSRQYMWSKYEYDAFLRRATDVSGLSSHDATRIDELYFLDTGEKVQGQTIFAQSNDIVFEDRSKGNKHRTYQLEQPQGVDLSWEIYDGNRLLIEDLRSELEEGREYDFYLRAHNGPAQVPSSGITIKLVYLP